MSRSPPPRARSDEGFKLYVGNLSWNTDDRSLKDTFSKFGNVSDCFIPKDRETGKAKGFGFVTFEDKRDADEAVAELNGKDIDGRSIAVNHARPRGEGGAPRGGGFGGGYGGDRGDSRGGYGGDSRGGYGGGGRDNTCRDFSQGRCSRGDSCRFDHNGGSSSRGGGRDRSPPRRDRY